MGRLEVIPATAIIIAVYISIPLWFDWKYFFWFAKYAGNWISIPLWFDWKHPHRRCRLWNQPISIPLWFDWKDQLPTNVKFIYLKFQFHYGSIGRDHRHLHGRVADLFQFHYGSIGRLCRIQRKGASPAFQFHYGSIGRPDWFCSGMFFQHFNSTMVRLEAHCWAGRVFAKRISIPLWFDWKSLRQDAESGCKGISIPLWFDWKHSGAYWSVVRSMISIPLWFDWKPMTDQRPSSRNQISIPLWFDWKPLVGQGVPSASVFQFHYGSIGSLGSET